MSSTVRIGEETREALRELARATGISMQDVLALAVETYRRRLILEGTNEAYAALRADPEGWRELEEERSGWDRTLLDGLEQG